jgi:phosphatidylinositol 4-kinase type 2
MLIDEVSLFNATVADASEFFRRHPLPDRSIADTYDDSNHRNPRLSKRILTALSLICGRAGETEDERYDLDDDEDDHGLYGSETPDRPFHWTPLLLQSLREELEK